MDDNQKEAYLAEGGNICPYCKSPDIEGVDSLQSDTGIAWQVIRCCACSETWRDLYKLVGTKRFSGLNTTEAAMVLGVMRSIFPWEGFDEPVSKLAPKMRVTPNPDREDFYQTVETLDEDLSIGIGESDFEDSYACLIQFGKIPDQPPFDCLYLSDNHVRQLIKTLQAFLKANPSKCHCGTCDLCLTGTPDSPSLEDTMFNHAAKENQ